MTETTILANARLVLPGEVLPGWLEMAGGVIRRIEAGTDLPTGAVDCEGDLVMPGLVELHTDNLERHLKPRPGVNWPQAAALLAHDAELAAVGITTVFDALRVGALVSRPYGAGEYARGVADRILAAHRAGALRVSHRLHLRAEICSETLERELDGFDPADRVGIVSLMDHTPGQRQFADIAIFRHYVRGKHGFSEAEFQEHLHAQQALGAARRLPHEAAAVAAAGRLGAVLASHDDTTEAHVAASARHGATIAEFPTTEAAALACHRAGIAVMMGAPNLIRGGSHSGNVAAEALARQGVLQVLSSDYVPSALLSGGLMLGAIWGDLARGLATVTAAPARAAGLADRGRLVEGLRADVIRVRRFGAEAAVRGTWVAGRRVA